MKKKSFINMFNPAEMEILNEIKSCIKLPPSDRLSDEDTFKVLEAITKEFDLPNVNPKTKNNHSKTRTNFQATLILAYYTYISVLHLY
jgi:hypothetical protein